MFGQSRPVRESLFDASRSHSESGTTAAEVRVKRLSLRVRLADNLGGFAGGLAFLVCPKLERDEHYHV